MKNKKLIIILGLTVILFLIYLGKSLFFVSPTKVISVLPLPESKNVVLQPEILIQFDQPVNQKQLNLRLQPDFQYELRLINQNRTLEIKTKEKLQPETTYTLNLKLKEEFSWSFTTGIEAGSRQDWSEDFSKEVENYLKLHQKEAETLRELKEKLPYSTHEFRIEYAIKTNKFFIFLYQEPYETNQQKALSWLKEQGITEPEKLNIFWAATKY